MTVWYVKIEYYCVRIIHQLRGAKRVCTVHPILAFPAMVSAMVPAMVGRGEIDPTLTPQWHKTIGPLGLQMEKSGV